MKRDNMDFKRELDNVTKLNCQARYDKLVRLVDTVKSKEKAVNELKKWEMNFSDDVVQFKTRILKQNNIIFSNKSELAPSRGWNLRDAEHISSVPLCKWVILFMPRDQETARSVENELIILSKPMGFKVTQSEMIRLSEERRDTVAGSYLKGLQEVFRRGRVQMVVCIVPGEDKVTYDAIKKICCLDYGIPSQVVKSKTLQNMKNFKSVMTKVAIQMSCKLGGEVWGVTIPLKSVMIIGIDVYTDTSEKTKRTVTAFVSSMNADVAAAGCTRWYSRCMMESKEQKYSDWVHIMMQSKRINEIIVV
jgi:aubergine-like protein